MALIVVLAVMDGFGYEIREKVLGTNAHIILSKYGSGIRDYRAVIKKVEEVPGVMAAAPFVSAQVMLSGTGGVAGAVVRGIDPPFERKVSNLQKSIIEGSIDSLNRDAGGEAPRHHHRKGAGQDTWGSSSTIPGDGHLPARGYDAGGDGAAGQAV